MAWSGWPRFDSLQSRLHLSILSTTTLGFGAAAAASLLLSRQEFLDEHRLRALHQAAPLIEMLERSAATGRAADAAGLRHALQNPTPAGLKLWLRLPDGRRLLAANQRGAGPSMLPTAVRNGDPAKPVLTRTGVGRDVLVQRLHHSRDGSELWAAEDVGESLRLLAERQRRQLLIWAGALGLTLPALSLGIRRGLRPLDKLSHQAAAMGSAHLDSSRLPTGPAPREIRELTEVFNTLLERLSSTWDHQRQFVSAVSHELRNPLTIISGYLRRLQRRGTNLQPEQLRALATAEAETHRITRLLNDLLDISRSEAGQLQLRPEPVAVDEILVMACDLSRSLLARRLELRLPPLTAEQPVLAMAEADRLQQVVLNLIENADKYTPGQSAIVVELARQRRDDGRMEVRISVCDQGIGIPPEDLPRIFDRFHRAANALERARGSGLGLSIVRLLVEAMGGRITVDSELGVGSRFHLLLPAAEESDSAPAATLP